MSRADLEAAAEEKYPVEWASDDHTASALADMRSGYIQGRLDQAEADARIAEAFKPERDRPDAPKPDWERVTVEIIAAAIRKGVQ